MTALRGCLCRRALVLFVLITSLSLMWTQVRYNAFSSQHLMLVFSASAVVMFLLGREFLESIWFSAAFFVVVAFAFTSPVFVNPDFVGRIDWDEFIFQVAVSLDSIMIHHQFPLWNPYYSGGNVLLAGPESLFLSPLLAPAMLLGPVQGVKAALVLSVILGMLGSFLLSREYDFGVFGSYLSSFVYMGGGVFFQHISVGHLGWASMCWLPWVFLFYLKSIKKLVYAIPSAMALTFMLFGGFPYLLAYTVLLIVLISALEVVLCFKRVGYRPFYSTVLIVCFFALFGAVKLIPMVEFYFSGFFVDHRLVSAGGGFLPAILYNAFLGGAQVYGSVKGHNMYMWHEYGSYVGIIPVFLVAMGLAFSIECLWPLAVALLFFAIMSMGEYVMVIFPFFLLLYWMLYYLPGIGGDTPGMLGGGYMKGLIVLLILSVCLVLSVTIMNPILRVPSRMIIIVLFLVSILSGAGLSFIERGRTLLTHAILFAVFFELLVTNGTLLNDAFNIPPDNVRAGEFIQSAGFPKNPQKFSEMYTPYLMNMGTVDGYDIVNVPKNAKSFGESGYRGEAYLEGNSGGVRMTSFTPNVVVVDVNNPVGDTLVLNQNYYVGWKSSEGEVKPHGGLVSLRLSPGVHNVVFYYQPFSFFIGLVISVVSIVACVTAAYYGLPGLE
ncbi:MAG: hypothetical protein V1744_02690 [Candidatus Altiarchaeota archaeon]